MAVPHPKTVKVLEIFLDNSLLGKYILGRQLIQNSVQILVTLARIFHSLMIFLLECLIFIPIGLLGMMIGVSSIFLIAAAAILPTILVLQYPQYTLSLLTLYASLKVVLKQLGYGEGTRQDLEYVSFIPNKIDDFLHLIRRTNIHLIQYAATIGQGIVNRINNMLGWGANLYKIFPVLNCGFIKLFQSAVAVDKLNISLTEYKNLLACVQDYFMQHGGVGPTRTLAQFTDGFLTNLQTQHHYAELQTFLRMGAFHGDFNFPALQYYQNNYLEKIISPINQELIRLRAHTEGFLNTVPSDLAVKMTGHFVAYGQYPQLASWMFDEIKAPEPKVPGLVPVAAPGG